MENEYVSRPKYFEKIRREALKKYIEAKEAAFEEYKEEAENIRKNAASEAVSDYLLDHPDGNFRDYLHTISVYKYKKGIGFCMIACAIIGVILYLILGSSMVENIFYALVAGAGMGLWMGAIMRPFCGYTYGVILCFIGYPIFKIFYNKAVAKEDARLRAVNSTFKQETAQTQEDYDAAIQESTEKVEKAIEEYKIGFAKEVEERCRRLQNSSVAKNIAEWATPIFKNLIDNAERGAHIETIEEEMYVTVLLDAVVCDADSFDEEKVYMFEENRCAKMEDVVEASAISLVISNLIKENIIQQYQGDASWADFTINVADDEDDENPCAIITYTAKNENYKPIQQW